MQAKKILIADDNNMMRKGMQLLLNAYYPHTEIIEAANGAELISQYKAHKPEIILTDYSMPKLNGYEAAKILLKEDKRVKVIMFTMFDTLTIALNFLKIGGRGFISKGNHNDQIIESIRVVATGDYYFSTDNEKIILKYLEEGIPQTLPKIKFTPLELSIVLKLSKGKTSKEISHELSLSPRTVETYRYDLIKKTRVKNSMELVEYIYKNGIAIFALS